MRSFIWLLFFNVAMTTSSLAQTQYLNPWHLQFGTIAGTIMQGNDSRISNAAQKNQNLSDLTNTSTARTNLGLGSMATQNTNSVVVTGGSLGGMILGNEGDPTYPSNGVRLDNGAMSIRVPSPYGTQNTAVGLSVVTNTNNGIAQVMGGWSSALPVGSGVAGYASRDKVAAYIGTMNNAPWSATATGFTVTSVTLTAPVDTTRLHVGMLIDVADPSYGFTGLLTDNSKWTGTISSWNTAGNTINVLGWYRIGNTTVGQIPTGTTLRINPTTKLWALNTNIDMWAGGEALYATGYELGINNNSGTDDNTDTMWGMDVVNLGSNYVGIGYIARGPLRDAYVATNGSDAGFLYNPPLSGYGSGFKTYQIGGCGFQSYTGTNGTTYCSNVSDGSIDIGAYGATSSPTTTPALRFHTAGGASATANASIKASGGTTGTGDSATLTYTASIHDFMFGLTGQGITIGQSGIYGVNLTAIGSGNQTLYLTAGGTAPIFTTSPLVVNAGMSVLGGIASTSSMFINSPNTYFQTNSASQFEIYGDGTQTSRIAVTGGNSSSAPAIITNGTGLDGLVLQPKNSGPVIVQHDIYVGTIVHTGYTYLTLPALGNPGREVFCTDCLKSGETTGSGTGMLVFDDGHSHWVTTAGTIASH